MTRKLKNKIITQRLKKQVVNCLSDFNSSNADNSIMICDRIQHIFFNLGDGSIIETVLSNNLKEEFNIFWKSDYTSSSIDMKILKLSLEFAVLTYLFEAFYKRSNVKSYPPPVVLFHFALHWLYQPDFGYYVENILIHYIDKTNNEQKQLFKRRFLSLQESYKSSFFPNRKITKYEAFRTRLLFKKTNLLRLIRVIVPIFKPSFWESLTSRQKYFFSANLISLTLKKGTYHFLNAFLKDNSSITFSETNIIIYGETINLNSLNSEASQSFVNFVLNLEQKKRLLEIEKFQRKSTILNFCVT